MKPLEAIRCTQPSCTCECFSPGKVCLRYCDSCSHGWVAHALDKLGYQHAYNLGMQVEVVQPNIVFDIASLMLYGAQATPVRLKILLDRLFSVLQHEEVLQVLHGFGWSYEDYARGYILQDSGGRVLDKWSIASRDEEHVILQQFLRFGETKAIAQEIILQDTRDKQDAYSKQTARAESEIKKFIERSNLSFMKLDPARQMFAGRLPFVPGARILTPPTILTPTPYSPSRDTVSAATAAAVVAARPLSLTTSPAAATSTPLSTPPISRLQAYEFRRELTNNNNSSASPVPGSSSSSADKMVSLPPAPTHTGMTVPTVVASMAAVVAAAATAAGHRSPVPESPRNLSTTPSSSSVHSAPSPCLTPHKSQPAPESGGEISAGYSEDSEDDHSVGAIDYSTKDTASSPSTATSTNTTTTTTTTSVEQSSKAAAAAAAARHLRKSNNPIKRQWIPSASFGNSFIGPNGKKRVLCTACNKTFCDKGALKIHYSAVHLKEMHKCTVEGCNMMFSSRRSRNRHSANPNPKLHMPQKRKELEGLEDDPKAFSSLASTSLTSTPLSTAASSLSSSSPNLVVNSPALVAAQRTLEAGGLLRADPAYFLELGAQFPFGSPPEKRIKLEEEEGGGGLGQQDNPTDLSSGSGSGSGSEKGKSNDEDKPETDTSSVTHPHPFHNPHNPNPIHPPDTHHQHHHHHNNNHNNDQDSSQQALVETESEMTTTTTTTTTTTSTSTTTNTEPDDATKGNDLNVQRGSGGNRRKSNAPLRCAKSDEAMAISDDDKDDLEKASGDPALAVSLVTPGDSSRLIPLPPPLPPPLPLPPPPPPQTGGVGVGVQAGGPSGALDVMMMMSRELQLPQKLYQQRLSDACSVPEGHLVLASEEDMQSGGGGGAAHFPQIASLLLAAKEQREKDDHNNDDGGDDDDDDSSENALVINGDAEEENKEEEEEEEVVVEEGVKKEEDEQEEEGGKRMMEDEATSTNDNDHNHNTVGRDERGGGGGGGEEGEEESCGSVPSPLSETAEGLAGMETTGQPYLDKDNCRRCALCGKTFLNQFSVKIHFQNVHLKLMHGCTVDGCSAAFPSKRSRDRHSSNLNLHRKMMSGGDSGLDSSADPTLREDILTTLYGANQLAMAAALNLQCNGLKDQQQDSAASPQDGPVPLVGRNSSTSTSTETSAGKSIAEPDAKPDENAEPSSNGPTEAEEGDGDGGQAKAGTEAEDQPSAERVPVRREEPVCMSRKPVCCGMTFHTESALKEHYSLSHPSHTLPSQTLPVQPLKPRHAPATETLLSSRRPRHRPKHKNGLHRLVSTGRKNGFS